MKRIALTLIGMAVAIALPAFADRMPLPTNTPASYKAECGSCHLAFPARPAFSERLATHDQPGLKDHFGTDAAVDGKNGQEIAAFLERYAGNAGKAGQRWRAAAHHPDRPLHPQASGDFTRKPGKTRASNRPPIAKPAIAARPRAITANTTSAFLN
jgi:hypothetical protein